MSNFKKAIDAKRKAARNAPPPEKHPSQMSEAELDAEEARLQREIRQSRERGIVAGREAREAGIETSSGGSTALAQFLASRKRDRRRSWK